MNRLLAATRDKQSLVPRKFEIGYLCRSVGRLFEFVVLVLIIISNSSANTTYVEGRISGVWDIEGSPYVVSVRQARIPEGEQLVIEPGVTVLLASSLITVWPFASLIAEGTIDDSIIFGPYLPPYDWWFRLNGTGESRMSFDYCKFINGGRGNAAVVWGEYMNEVIVKNSSFIACGREIVCIAITNFLMSDCYIEPRRSRTNSLYFNASERVEIRRTILKSPTFWSIEVTSRQAMISNCYFDSSAILFMNSNDRHQYTLENCIFDGISRNDVYFNYGYDPGVAIEPTAIIENNCFYTNNDSAFPRLSPEGLAILDRTNLNGDSTDRYGNIFLDPGIVEGWEWGDEEFLTEDSPCINAGNPDSPPDPDTTIADIGPFFFSQPNIAVSADSFAFDATPVGESDTLLFSIRNRGDQRELRYFLDEEAMDRSFRITGWGGDTASLAAGESAEFGLIFQPREAREYPDTLRIVSNDRDEGLIALPVRAFAANSVGDEPPGQAGTPILLSVSPNPFNSSTTITFSTGSAARPTRLAIYDLQGKLVADLTNSAFRTPHSAFSKVVWDASGLGAGVYFVRLEAGDQVVVRKVLLMR